MKDFNYEVVTSQNFTAIQGEVRKIEDKKLLRKVIFNALYREITENGIQKITLK